MKTLGLLGGMSWESTALYYQLLNRHVRATQGGLHSCACIVHSFDFAVIEKLQASGDWVELGTMLGDAAAGLARAGADAIVICTNTMHKVASNVEARSRLPVLHIADMTGAKIVAAGVKRVALLATRYTMEQEFYKSRLVERFGLEVVVPDTKGRDIVHKIIYEELCNGVIKEESRAQYVKIAMEPIDLHGAEGVIFGCTEIGMLLQQSDFNVPCFDTTVIHAEGAAEWAMGN